MENRINSSYGNGTVEKVSPRIHNPQRESLFGKHKKQHSPHGLQNKRILSASINPSSLNTSNHSIVKQYMKNSDSINERLFSTEKSQYHLHKNNLRHISDFKQNINSKYKQSNKPAKSINRIEPSSKKIKTYSKNDLYKIYKCFCQKETSIGKKNFLFEGLNKDNIKMNVKAFMAFCSKNNITGNPVSLILIE